MAATLSLDRCMTNLHLDQIKADGAGFGPFRPDAVADGLLGILRHQSFELALGPLVVEVGRSGLAKQSCKFGPGVGSVHVDYTNRFNPWFRRFTIDQRTRFAALDSPSQGL